MSEKRFFETRLFQNSLIAVASVVTGIFLMVPAARLPIWSAATNFTVTSHSGQTLMVVSRSLALFMLGSYIGNLGIWYYSRGAESRFFPGLVAVCSACGAVLGWGFQSIIQSTTGLGIAPGIENSPEIFGSAGHIIFPLMGAWGGAYFGTLFREESHGNFFSNFIAPFVGLIFFACLPILTYQKSDFPAERSIEIRFKWAQRNFGEHFDLIGNLIASSPLLKNHLGDRIGFAPLSPLPNKIVFGPGESIGHFSLEVIGSQSAGLLKATVLIPTQNDGNGTEPARLSDIVWEFEGRRYPLKADGSLNEGDAKLEEILLREQAFFTKISELYKMKKYSEVAEEYNTELKSTGHILHDRELASMMEQTHVALGNASEASFFRELATYHE